MPRIYRVTFEGINIAAQQDMISVFGAGSKVLRILRRWVKPTDTTPATAQDLQLRDRILQATIAPGSGGAIALAQRMDQGDSAASFAAHVNDTTKTTSGGTIAIIDENGCYLYNGFDEIFINPPTVGPNQAYVFELLTTLPLTPLHLSGGVEVEENG